jgi:hypothetical protein
MRQTWKGEGLRGFYGGMIMAIVRVNDLISLITSFSRSDSFPGRSSLSLFMRIAGIWFQQ